MAITFLEEEPAKAPSKRKITFLDEEAPSRLFAAPEVEAPAEPKATFTEGAEDIGRKFLMGGAGGIRSLTDVFGANNPVSKAIAGVEDYIAEGLSAESQQNSERISKMFDEAESKGLGAKVAVGLEAFASAPAETLAQVGGYMIPNLAAGVLGKAAKLGKLGMTAAQAATGAAMGAGTVKGEIYRGVTDYLREQGVPEDQIDNVATEAQAYGGKNMDQILLATGIGAAAASTGVEKIFTRILTRTGGEVTDKSIASVLKNGLKGAATETAVEVPQEMQEQVATNIALQREGAEVPTFRGAVQAGAMAAPAALLLGGAAGGVEVMTAEDKAEQEINRDADKEARNLSVPEGDTSAKVVVNEINRRENAITSLQEELDTLEPADPRAQQLRLDIASLQKGKAQLKKRNKEPLTQVEEKQAELAAIIAAEPAAGLSETITQPAPPAPAPTIGEKPPTSPMIGAEPTQPAPAELYPQGTSLTESITTTKEKIGDRIPAFKVGDFFEFFGDDADLTGTTVTKRGENKMSGVPYYDQARLQEIANRTGKPVAIINRETRTVESEVAPSVPTAAPSIVSEAIRITNERKTRWEATDPQDRSATFNFVGRAEVELENLIGNLAGKENATARQNLIAEITGVKPTIQKSALKDVRQAISGYLQANPIQSLSEPSRAAIPAAPAVTTPPAPEAVTPAPEGITVGNRIKLGKSPQGYVVEEVIESTPQEKELGEQYFRVKNERTGETQVVEQKDLIQIKPKRIRAKRGQMTPLPQERQATFEDVESRVKTFFGGTIPSRVTITNNPNAPDTAKGSYDPETGIIEFNLAFIPKEDNIEDIVTHELGHFMFGDTKVKKAFDAFYNSLTPDEKAQVDKIVQDSYNEETGEVQLEEAQVVAFSSFAKLTPERTSLWNTVLDAIKAALNRVLGTKFTMSDPVRTAIHMVNAARRGYVRGREIPREGGRRMITQSQDARFAELEARAKAGDKEAEAEAQRMVDEAAKASGLPILDDSASEAYRARRTPPPKKTIKGYKLFTTKPNRPGELFPLFVGANESVPQGVWLDAIEGKAAAPSKTGKPQVKSKLGPLAFRPGWHAGDLPLATHIGVKNAEGKVSARRANEVWAEVELANDTDYQPQADASKTRDLRSMPKDGAYRFKTNPNMTGNWIISGSMKVNRVMSQQEVDSILEQNNITPMPWEGGVLDLQRMGLSTEEAVNTLKLSDPFTYDDAGNLIPLSERFQPTTPDIRRAAEKPAIEITPESPEGQTIPQALANGVDIGPENNMPVNRKIDSHLKNFLFLRGFFESASDRLRRVGFSKLGNAIDAFFDGARRRLGDANKIMLAPLEAYEAAPSARKKEIEEDFQTFFAAQENKRDTETILQEMDPIARRIVKAWQKFGEQSGKENQRIGVKVFDPKTQSWRKIGRVEKFWPRRLKPEYQRALYEPDKYAKEYNEIVEALLEDNKISKREDAEKYLREYSPEATKNDYFSGIEKARGKPLPEKLYDYSMPVMTDYIARWAQHVSRIEQFGQKTSEQSQTLWDREMATTRDPRTKDYIQAARERVEGYFPNDPFLKGTSALNIWATGLQLGNPASAILNLIGGSTLNAMVGQPGALGSYVSSLSELRNLGQQIRDAKEKGILGRDLMNIVGDHQAILETNKVARAGQKTSDFLLKWSGFTPVEQMIRTQSLIIGKSFVRNTLNAFSENPNSPFAKRASAWITRNGFDLDKLIVENGTGPETDRVLRYFANISQGSYTIDQVPIFIDMPIGRFLFKYQKFSTQVMRMSWKNTFEPLFKAMTGKGERVQVPDKTRQLIYQMLQAQAKELGDNRPINMATIPKTTTKGQARALTLLPAMMWLGSAYVGGEVLLRIRDILFGVLMKGPEYEDMLKELEDDDKAGAMYLALERAWYNLIGIGALGLIGNYAQFFLDWQDRERVKNPLEPPSLGILKDTAQLVTTVVDQGTLTGGDIDNFTRSTLSAYRTTQKLAQSTAGFLGLEDIPGVKEEMFRREVANINKYARRWAEEAGIEYRMRRPTEITASPRTPVNRKIAGYLQTGNPQAAVAYAKAYLNTLPKADRLNAIQSISAGARNRQPLRLGTGPMDEVERRAFLKWLKGEVNEERYKEIAGLDKQYQRDYEKFLRLLPNR